jgi:hypothetical protein
VKRVWPDVVGPGSSSNRDGSCSELSKYDRSTITPPRISRTLLLARIARVAKVFHRQAQVPTAAVSAPPNITS